MAVAKTVGAYEAKTTLAALLELVAEGHEVVITKHERPVARLVPFARATAAPELFHRVRALRGRMKLQAGETPKALVTAGRRI
jgi:prevent-host-death family protein